MGPLALFGCAVTILAWGAASIFDKLSMKEIDPFSGVLVRMVFITVAVLVFCAATGRLRPVLDFPPHTFLYLLISGLLGGLIGQLAYYIAIKHAPVSQVVPITATYPVIAFLLAVAFLREQPTVAKILGVLFVVGGLMLISGGNNKAAEGDSEAPPAITAASPSQSPAPSQEEGPPARDQGEGP